MRDGLVPCLALRLPETIKYHAGLSFFIESFGERGASCPLARRRSPGPHLVLSSRHLPLPSSRSAALATGQGARTGLLLQRAKVNVVERATQLHGLCVRCGHRVHSGALSWIAPQGGGSGRRSHKLPSTIESGLIPLTETALHQCSGLHRNPGGSHVPASLLFRAGHGRAQGGGALLGGVVHRV